MRKILLFISCCMLAGCEISYDSETRFVLNTVVKDRDGQPAPNVKATLTVFVDDDFETISQGRTDQNGQLTFIFPDTNAEIAHFDLEIAHADPVYVKQTHYHLPKSSFEEDYTFSIAATLAKHDQVVSINLSFSNQTQTGSLSGYEIIASKPEIYVPYDTEHPSFGEWDRNVKVYKNQTAQLVYSVRNTQTNIITEYTESLTVGTEDIDFTINY